MRFDLKYFKQYNFTNEEILKHFQNAKRDLDIAYKDKILDVKFNYTYNALIKGSIALLSYHQMKLKSVPGHHMKLIDILAEMLEDQNIADIGHVIRSKRNIDLYSGGTDVTKKECSEFLEFVTSIIIKIEKVIMK